MRLSTIYLDDQATTAVDPRVFEAMRPFFCEAFGNPSSQSHAFGWQAEVAVEKARVEVAELLNAEPHHIVFTSGATESNNLAICGVMNSDPFPAHLIVSATEHKAVLEVAQNLERQGHQITVLPVNRWGQVTVEALKAAIRPNTKLISVMWANNEIGTINPIADLAAVARQNGIWFHTDAAQAASRLALDVRALDIDLLSLSGHKMYGPKGVGALFVRRDRVPLRPLFFGGSQEWGLRPGTLNVPGIVGLGHAAKLAKREGALECDRLRAWQSEIVKTVLTHIPRAHLNGHPTIRLSSNLSFSFYRLPVEILRSALVHLAYSSGAACSSQQHSTSHVLAALKLPEDWTRSTLRLGFGRFTQPSEILELQRALMKLGEKINCESKGLDKIPPLSIEH